MYIIIYNHSDTLHYKLHFFFKHPFHVIFQLLLECPEISNKDVFENAAQHLELSNTDTKAVCNLLH